MSVGIILLAAGSSSRMGQPKQLLQIKGDSLLLTSVKVALEANLNNVVVVLGSNAEAHHTLIENLPVMIVTNTEWQKGMGNSLKKGITCLLQTAPSVEAIITMVCDQPLLTSAHLRNLVEKYHESKKKIVASHYNNTSGVPALFDQSLFEELQSCGDEQGAKKIIHQHQDLVTTIDFPGGEIDLDSPEDYHQFIQLNP